jgi:hypothetical protein
MVIDLLDLGERIGGDAGACVRLCFLGGVRVFCVAEGVSSRNACSKLTGSPPDVGIPDGSDAALDILLPPPSICSIL